MADDDLIYVPTAGNGLGYNASAGNALAYKWAAAPKFGQTVNWTAGDLYKDGVNLTLTNTGTKYFESPTLCNIQYGAARPSSAGYYANTIVGDVYWFWRIQIQWDASNNYCDLRFIGYSLNSALYRKTGVARPVYPESRAPLGTYFRVSGLNLGTVTVTE